MNIPKLKMPRFRSSTISHPQNYISSAGNFFRRIWTRARRDRKSFLLFVCACALLLSGIIFTLAELGSYGVNGPATAPNSLDWGLVGHWDMEEGSGQSVSDKSGNGNDGTLGTTSSADASDPAFVSGHDASGPLGSGLGFDGGSDYVDAGTGASLGLTNTGSISLWIKPNSLIQDDFAGFVTRRSNTAGGTAANYSYSFHWRQGDSVIRLALSNGSTLNYATMPLLTDTNWHHLVGLWDGSNLKLFEDGVLAATPVAQVMNAQAGAGFNTVLGGNSFSTSAVNRQEFNGSIDEVRIYNRALTEDEIRLLYNQKKPVLEMNFDEGSGTIAHDESFNDNDGTLGGDGLGTDLPTWTDGKNSGGLAFDGDNDYVDAGDVADMGTSDMTVSVWFKKSSSSVGVAEAVVAKARMDYAGPLYDLLFAEGLLGGEFSVAYGDYAFVSTSETPYLDNQWHLATLTFDRDGNLTLYVDGVNKDSTDISAYASINMNNANSFFVGAFQDGTGTAPLSGSFLTGSLDGVRIYNYARTADEVNADYNDGLAARFGSESTLGQGLVGYWNMEEGSGQTVQDRSGNGNDGVLGANAAVDSADPSFAPGHDASGPAGTGLVFDGINDYVSAGNGSSLNVTGAISMSVWVKPAVSDGNLVRKVAVNQGYMMYLISNQRVEIGSNEFSSTLTTSNSAITLNSWNHIVATIDGSGVANIFVNGVLVKTGNLQVLNTTTGSSFIIGGSSWSSGAYANGVLDEVRLYKRALSPDEVRQLYNQKKPLLQMDFDEGSGTVAHDVSFSGNDGTLGGDGAGTDLPVWVQGKSGSALSFDGSDDYVSAPVILDANEVTVSFFMEDLGTTIAGSDYIKLSPGGGDQIVMEIDDTLSRVVPKSVVVGSSYYAPSVPIGAGFNQYALVFSSAGNYRKTYMNGRLIGTNAYGAGNFPILTLSVGLGTKAKIDNLRIYNYARTDDEIVTDYNSGRAAHLGKDTQDLNRGLVGRWDFSEGRGQTLYDVLGANNGTLGNSSSVGADDPVFASGHDASGEKGTGLSFDGIDDFAKIDAVYDFTGGFSESFWFYRRSDAVQGLLDIEMDFGNHYRVFLSGSSIEFDKSPGEVGNLTGTTAINQWTHVVATHDGTTASLYVNGVLAGQAVADFDNMGTTVYFFVGELPSFPLDGAMDDLRIYNRALSLDEIQGLYNQKQPVLEMDFDEGSGGTARDQGLYRSDGTLGGGTSGYMPTWVDGKFGSALRFDGTDDFVSAPLVGMPGKNVTVAAFVKISGAGQGTFIKVGSGANGYGIGLGNTNFGDTGTRLIGLYEMLRWIDSGYNFPSPGWYHVALEISDDGSPSFFVNGVQVGSAGAGLPIAPLTAVTIGGYGDATRCFAGDIDEVRVYNYQRSPSELLADYNNGLAAHLR